MDKIGVIHGRFQMLHKGHMEYLLAGKERCERLIVGICNPDITLMKHDEVDLHRATLSSNPLTYLERYEMIKGALNEAGVDSFDVVPFPINFPELIRYYVPLDAKFYITIYDQWGKKKKNILENLGCNVEVMWVRNKEDRFTSGTEVRQKIIKNEEWSELVPPFVYKYTIEHGIERRIRDGKY